MSETYNTTDMYVAAALLSYGCQLLNVNREDKRRQIFSFSFTIPAIIISEEDVKLKSIKTPTSQDFEKAYFSERLWLPPSYPDSVRRIKSLIRSHGEK